MARDKYSKHFDEWIRAYKEVSKLSGFSFEELDRESRNLGVLSALILDRNNKYYGNIGIVDLYFTEGGNEYCTVKFKKNKKIIRETFSGKMFGKSGKLEEKVYYAINVIMVLEKRDKLLSKTD